MFKVYVFDFDGVITKNDKEIVMLCKNVWGQMGNDPKKISSKGILKLRPYIVTAGDYYFLLQLLSKGSKINKEKLSGLAEKYRKECALFEKMYFAERRRMQDEDFDKWVKLYKSLDFVVAAIKQLTKSSSVYIASNKDGRTLGIMIKYLGIEIPEEKIVGGEHSEDKYDHLSYVMKVEDAKPEDVIFIDDSIRHLKSVMRLGVNVAYASWGYCTKDKVAEARRLGIPVATRANFSKLMGLR